MATSREDALLRATVLATEHGYSFLVITYKADEEVARSVGISPV